MTVGIFLILIACLFICGTPIFTAIGGSSLIYALATDIPIATMFRRMFSGIDSTGLMCIPFFMLAGNLMAKGGIAKRLVDICQVLVGGFSGGLSFVCILACTFFAAITGSGVACCVALAAILIPAMIESGYSRLYAVTVCVAGSILGPIIPPSVSMAQFSGLSETSLAALYKGGVPTGLMIAAALFIYCYFACKRKGYKPLPAPPEQKTFKYKFNVFKKGIWALGAPIIILGSIFGGICTPTEASVLAVLYSIIIAVFVYKEIKIKELPQIFFDSAATTSRMMMIGSCASFFAMLLTYVNLPQKMLSAILTVTDNQTLIILIMMGVLFILGMFLEPSSILFVTVPMFLPLCNSLGIDKVYFGVLMTIMLALGCATPPFGTLLYAASYVGKVPVMKLGKSLLPIILLYLVMILIFVLFPGTFTWVYS